MVDIQNKGILVFEDKGRKFIDEKHALKNLTSDCDIKVSTQDKQGKPVALTVEVSQAGTLDRDTFERKEGAPVVCEKMSYEKSSPMNLFGRTRKLTYILKGNIDNNIGKQFYAMNGSKKSEISEADYHNIDFVL